MALDDDKILAFSLRLGMDSEVKEITYYDYCGIYVPKTAASRTTFIIGNSGGRKDSLYTSIEPLWGSTFIAELEQPDNLPKERLGQLEVGEVYYSDGDAKLDYIIPMFLALDDGRMFSNLSFDFSLQAMLFPFFHKVYESFKRISGEIDDAEVIRVAFRQEYLSGESIKA